jgi:hypothetical protein
MSFGILERVLRHNVRVDLAKPLPGEKASEARGFDQDTDRSRTPGS